MASSRVGWSASKCHYFSGCLRGRLEPNPNAAAIPSTSRSRISRFSRASSRATKTSSPGCTSTHSPSPRLRTRGLFHSRWPQCTGSCSSVRPCLLFSGQVPTLRGLLGGLNSSIRRGRRVSTRTCGTRHSSSRNSRWKMRLWASGTRSLHGRLSLTTLSSSSRRRSGVTPGSNRWTKTTIDLGQDGL